MEDILFTRTFLILWWMLLITAITAFFNKSFETKREMLWTVIWSFAVLIAVMIFSDSFPLNILLVALFSGFIGWNIWPTIEFYKTSAKRKRFMRVNNIILKKWESLSEEQNEQFQQYLIEHPISEEDNKIVAQAFMGTALAVIATSWIVFLTDYDFSFMESFLFIALLILVIMWILNLLFFRSKTFSLIRAYLWVIIFTGYLLFDFNQLEKSAGDESRATAIDIAVNIYLDIINLFLSLLEILGSWD